MTTNDIPPVNINDSSVVSVFNMYPTFTLAQVKDEIRKDRERFITGIEGTKRYLTLPDSPLTQLETKLVTHTLSNVLEKLRTTPIEVTE